MQTIDQDPAASEAAPCAACGAIFPAAVWRSGGRQLFRQAKCGPCLEAENAAAARRRSAQAAARRRASWLGLCPPAYRETRASDPRLHPHALAAALAWEAGAGRGLGLLGPTGLGKTRCAFLALDRSFEAGRTVAFVSHMRFSRLVGLAYGGNDSERAKAKVQLRQFETAEVLLLDDLGKAPATERADSELLELLETRTSAGLPILWTANGSGSRLLQHFGSDCGEPILRRLGEFCAVHNL